MRTLDDDFSAIQGSFFEGDRNADIPVLAGREP